MSSTISVTLHHTKETKRMHRYEALLPEDAYSDVLGSIYISKAKLKGQVVPLKLEVLITPIEK